MVGMFESCNELEYLDLSEWDTSNVISMKVLFQQCDKLKQIKLVNKFSTNKVVSMAGMFQKCYELENLDLTNFNTANVTNIECMFHECKKLKKIKGISKFNTNKVISMERMFDYCLELEYLDLTNWNTMNVIDMKGMFNYCQKLKEIKGINNFNIKKVELMNGMFQSCEQLEYLDLSKWDTSNATNMNYLFNQCYKLKTIKGINRLIKNKSKTIIGIFQYCKNLEYLDISEWDISNISNMDFIFAACSKLKEIKGLNKLKTNKVVSMQGIFYQCYELEYLDLSNWDTTNVTNMNYMFYECNKLKYLNLLNFSVNCSTKDMLIFDKLNNLEFITNSLDLWKLCDQSSWLPL